MDRPNDYIARCQSPPAGKLVLDHVAHFVPDSDAAVRALGRLGFVVTPFSPHRHRDKPDAPLAPAGTGNVCVMLRRGYLEFLSPTAGTPAANRLRDAMARYVGIHLVALGTADPESDRARLAAAGFAPLPVLSLERPVDTPDGERLARFGVARTAADAMPEGRIQFVRQKTPELLWQRRWLDHPNRAFGLAAVYLCVADPAAAAARYERYLGVAPSPWPGAHRIATARGDLLFVAPDVVARRFGIDPPTLPWIAGYALECGNAREARSRIEVSDLATRDLDVEGRFMIVAPDAIGGIMTFGLIGRALPALA